MAASNRDFFVPQQELAVQREYCKKVQALLDLSYPPGYEPRAFVHSYGCQQNVSDGEKLKGLLCAMGYVMTDKPEDADFVMYNTCAVREHAEQRVYGNVGALKNLRRRRPGMLIGLCGCMTQQKSVAEKLKKSFPQVDLILGTHVLHKLPQLVYEKMSGGGRIVDISESDGVIAEGLPTVRDGGAHAWVPIMYGCNNFCSYCIVPYVRGRERSRKSEDILAEIRGLVAQGVREITLLGQNVNSYGRENGEISFPQLLRFIDALPGDFRIRFMTSHPKDAGRELIDAMADCPKVCRHLHLPVQSGSDRILRAMNRKYSIREYLDTLRYARERMPELSLSSDIIVGFPGETQEDFEATLALIKQVRYDQLYTFIYSKRPGTPAAEMEDPTGDEEKSRRFRQLLKVQEDIAYAKTAARVNTLAHVLCDGPAKEDISMSCGRDEHNGMVLFRHDEQVRPGDFVDVRIGAVKGYTCIGEIERNG